MPCLWLYLCSQENTFSIHVHQYFLRYSDPRQRARLLRDRQNKEQAQEVSECVAMVPVMDQTLASLCCPGAQKEGLPAPPSPTPSAVCSDLLGNVIPTISTSFTWNMSFA